MTTYRFAITELRHHDFANRLDELYDKAMGKRLSYKDSFFECHNQANLLTIYYHFPNIVYRQNNRTFPTSEEQNQCQSQALQFDS